jgi:hypothetical protein
MYDTHVSMYVCIHVHTYVCMYVYYSHPLQTLQERIEKAKKFEP